MGRRVHHASLALFGAALLGLAPLGCKTSTERSAGAGDDVPVPAKTAPPEPKSPAPPEPEPEPEPTRPETPQNVILLTIDSLRAEMPWTGYERPIAPNLSRLAERGVVYTHAYAVSSYTAKSVGALLTGRYPASLYRTGYFFTGYSDANLFFTEVLEAKGIPSVAGHAHMYFGRGKNLDQGFSAWEIVPGIDFDSETDKHITSPKLTDLAIKLLSDEKVTSKQFFAWFHYMDPHDQYLAHAESPDFGRFGRDRYDSEVFFTDLHVGRFLAWAEKQPFWDDTVIIVSADHGEAFGEHDVYRHAFWLWEVLVRVPLIVAGPKIAATRIDERRSHIDLAPTILDIMAVDAPEGVFVGQSLGPELYGEAKPEPREVIVLDLSEDSHNPPVFAVISQDYKLIVYGESGKRELYDLANDPDEKIELSKKEPEQLARMQAVFDKTWKEDIPRVEPYGGAKLRSGRIAKGPSGPPDPPSEKTADD
jgi:choline-sulfatase